MGDLAYDYLTHETQVDLVPHFSDWLGQQLPPDNAWSIDNPPPGYVSERSTPDAMNPSPSFPSYFPSTPSPSPSQASTPEHQRVASPPQELSCRHANPSKSVRGKWCCDACGKNFRGRWECKRHIMNAGKQAMCLACNKKINGREDSLRRHYRNHCKRMDLGRNSGNR
ncbi:hypothetical protein BDM02DRAFT_2473026 [Thelephora ganbajun]|uniref:Uncharacterized protein n=1 Tax=Thelephora ganbajun TaxID=370292 RepID=A0ACB6ZFJ4_THEGA|nr:hypothetical protein BDM02DRAFT_2473026 [Thelephora ganbajun]